MSNFKLEFTLQQHTPLIHFQSDQKGATLRATELKPKLDSFLIKYAFDDDFEKYKTFLIGYKEPQKPTDKKMTENDFEGKLAFDYRVRINSKIKETKDNFKTKKLGAYFGNLSSIELENIKIFVFSFQDKLIEKIKELFAKFILITNFGTRQNKGFGSFSVQKINGVEVTLGSKKTLEKHYLILNELNSSTPLKDIVNFYQEVKSGNSMRNKKSKIMKYFLHKEIRWEKRWIKRRLKEQNRKMFDDLKDEYHTKNSFDFRDNEKYFYIRALLGLSNMEFITYQFEKFKKEADEIKNKINKEDDWKKKKDLKNAKKALLKKADGFKIRVTVEHNEDDKKKKIERFPSPIFFKVINNNIYTLLPKHKPLVDRDILGQEFNFVASYKNGSDNVALIPSLKVPLYSNEALIKMYQNLFKKEESKASQKKKRKYQDLDNQLVEGLKNFKDKK